MEKKPIPLIILAVMQLLTPVASILMTSLFFHIPMKDLFNELLHFSAWYKNLDFFLAGPICAFAIYRVRPWSYPVFLGTSIWVAVNNIITWQKQPQVVSFGGLLFFLSLNVILVGYFLLPQVRKLYFDYSIRWWDTPPRFIVNLPISLLTGQGKENATLINISRGGALIKCSNHINAKTELQIQLQTTQKNFEFTGNIVWAEKNEKTVAGVRFQLTSLQAFELKNYLDELDAMGVERRPKRSELRKDLKEWSETVIKSGKGIIPEIPATAKSNTSSNGSDKNKAA